MEQHEQHDKMAEMLDIAYEIGLYQSTLKMFREQYTDEFVDAALAIWNKEK